MTFWDSQRALTTIQDVKMHPYFEGLNFQRLVEDARAAANAPLSMQNRSDELDNEISALNNALVEKRGQAALQELGEESFSGSNVCQAEW